MPPFLKTQVSSCCGHEQASRPKWAASAVSSTSLSGWSPPRAGLAHGPAYPPPHQLHWSQAAKSSNSHPHHQPRWALGADTRAGKSSPPTCPGPRAPHTLTPLATCLTSLSCQCCSCPLLSTCNLYPSWPGPPVMNLSPQIPTVLKQKEKRKAKRLFSFESENVLVCQINALWKVWLEK